MGPKQAYFRLNRAGPQGQIPGKILGPEGKPLLAIDGPHSAPTQHVGEYSVVMVVGAGECSQISHINWACYCYIPALLHFDPFSYFIFIQSIVVLTIVLFFLFALSV